MIDLGMALERWTQEQPLNQVTARGYGHYASMNYGSNAIAVRIGHLELFFSYGKIVAFRGQDGKLAVVKNVFSNTTGKHLTWIDNGNTQSRLDVDDFILALSEELYI